MKSVLVCALAAEAAAFAPAVSPMGGARLLGATAPRAVGLAAARAPRRTRVAAAPALRAQLGLNDKEGGTAVDDFKKDGQVPRACPSGSPLPSACSTPELRGRAARFCLNPLTGK